MKKFTIFTATLAVALLAVNPGIAISETVTGGNFIATGNDIVVECLEKDASYSSRLYVTVDDKDKFLFWSRQTGKTKRIKARFAPEGAYVEFRLVVQNTGETFYSGSADRNEDGVVHVQAHNNYDGTWDFGFEDIYGGGDEDYNDCNYRVSGISMQGGLERVALAAFQVEEAEMTEYIPVNTKDLTWLDNGSLHAYRVQYNSVSIDWTLFHPGDIDAELDVLVDGEWITLTGSTELEYFNLLETKKREGLRLSSYDYPDIATYIGKLRVEKVKGVGTGYLYFHGTNLHELNQPGVDVSWRIRLSQDDELKGAYEGNKVQKEVIK